MVTMSTSTVGLPRLSITSRAWMLLIVDAERAASQNEVRIMSMHLFLIEAAPCWLNAVLVLDTALSILLRVERA